ncbi:MAG: hypothetical protein NZ556_01720 [Fimbriimonadales bacterium]|nr:hypothetical protein [Fimbriimonadales bacterium]
MAWTVLSKPLSTDRIVRATLHGLEARATKSVAWTVLSKPLRTDRTVRAMRGCQRDTNAKKACFRDC